MKLFLSGIVLGVVATLIGVSISGKTYVSPVSVESVVVGSDSREAVVTLSNGQEYTTTPYIKYQDVSHVCYGKSRSACLEILQEEL